MQQHINSRFSDVQQAEITSDISRSLTANLVDQQQE